MPAHGSANTWLCPYRGNACTCLGCQPLDTEWGSLVEICSAMAAPRTLEQIVCHCCQGKAPSVQSL